MSFVGLWLQLPVCEGGEKDSKEFVQSQIVQECYIWSKHLKEKSDIALY